MLLYILIGWEAGTVFIDNGAPVADLSEIGVSLSVLAFSPRQSG